MHADGARITERNIIEGYCSAQSGAAMAMLNVGTAVAVCSCQAAANQRLKISFSMCSEG